MTKAQDWLVDQRAQARQDLDKATRELVHRIPGAAKQFVGDRPGISMGLAAAAGFAAAFAAVRISTAEHEPEKPPPREEPPRTGRGTVAWMQSATQALRAFVSAAALVKAVSSEMSARSTVDGDGNGHAGC